MVTVLDPTHSIGCHVVTDVVDPVGVRGGHDADHEEGDTPREEVVVFDSEGRGGEGGGEGDEEEGAWIEECDCL
jgi:hypothetical protein